MTKKYYNIPSSSTNIQKNESYSKWPSLIIVNSYYDYYDTYHLISLLHKFQIPYP